MSSWCWSTVNECHAGSAESVDSTRLKFPQLDARGSHVQPQRRGRTKKCSKLIGWFDRSAASNARYERLATTTAQTKKKWKKHTKWDLWPSIMIGRWHDCGGRAATKKWCRWLNFWLLQRQAEERRTLRSWLTDGGQKGAARRCSGRSVGTGGRSRVCIANEAVRSADRVLQPLVSFFWPAACAPAREVAWRFFCASLFSWYLYLFARLYGTAAIK